MGTMNTPSPSEEARGARACGKSELSREERLSQTHKRGLRYWGWLWGAASAKKKWQWEWDNSAASLDLISCPCGKLHLPHSRKVWGRTRGRRGTLSLLRDMKPKKGVCSWAGTPQEGEAVRDLMCPESELRAQGMGAQHPQTQPPCTEPPL